MGILSLIFRRNSSGGLSPNSFGAIFMAASLVVGTIYINSEYEKWKVRHQAKKDVENIQEQIQEKSDARERINKQKEFVREASDEAERIRRINCIIGGVCD